MVSCLTISQFLSIMHTNRVLVRSTEAAISFYVILIIFWDPMGLRLIVV